jgi:hypothetical protein
MNDGSAKLPKTAQTAANIIPHPNLRAACAPELTAADVQAVLNDLQPDESAAERLKHASEWAPILGPLYSKTRLFKAKKIADAE